MEEKITTTVEPVAPSDVCRRNAATGKIALAAAVFVAILLVLPPVKPLIAGLGKFGPGMLAIGIIFPAMILCELILFKPYRDFYDFSSRRVLDYDARRRVAIKFLVHLSCLLVVGAFYAAATLIKDTFFMMYVVLFPVLLIVPLIYFWLTERFGKAEVPEKYFTADLLRTYLIKGVFIPFTTIACFTAWLFWQEKGAALFSHVWSMSSTAAIAGDAAFIYGALVPLIVACDITVCAAGYICSTKLLGTHIVRTDPFIFSWLVCLVCYPPFDKILHYGSFVPVESVWPIEFATAFPIISIFCCAATLLLWAGYTWSTLTFGLRFSNLTNRGIINFGPYSVVRHPAYVMKNLCWWITLVPSAMLDPASMWRTVPALALITVIYVLRAISEERNLSLDSTYIDYKRRVRWRFIPWVI